MDSFITVNCKVSFTEYDTITIGFTFEDIPLVISSLGLSYYLDNNELKLLNFHVNDDSTICSVSDLKDWYNRNGMFAMIEVEKYESSRQRTERIKRELANPELKLSAPRDIFMKFIIKTKALVNKAELYRLYPDAYKQYSDGEGNESNPVSIIYEKKNRMFPSSGGRRKNGRHCRRTRQKTKRVKRAKLRKRSRKANHIKNVKH